MNRPVLPAVRALRRGRLLLVAVAGVLWTGAALLEPTPVRAAAPAVVPAVVPAQSAVVAASGVSVGPPVVIDGMRLDYLPAPLGQATDVTYDFDEVDFASRTWESPRPGGGWRVDLDVVVMRGPRLADPAALRAWFPGYQQRDPEPTWTPVTVHGTRGWMCADELFWFVRPGVAVSAQIDGSRWTGQSLVRLAAAADTTGL